MIKSYISYSKCNSSLLPFFFREFMKQQDRTFWLFFFFNQNTFIFSKNLFHQDCSILNQFSNSLHFLRELKNHSYSLDCWKKRKWWKTNTNLMTNNPCFGFYLKCIRNYNLCKPMFDRSNILSTGHLTPRSLIHILCIKILHNIDIRNHTIWCCSIHDRFKQITTIQNHGETVVIEECVK